MGLIIASVTDMFTDKCVYIIKPINVPARLFFFNDRYVSQISSHKNYINNNNNNSVCHGTHSGTFIYVRKKIKGKARSYL